MTGAPERDRPDQGPVVITGASSGIGAATARRLAAAGRPVGLGARRVDRCEEIAREIRDAGGVAVSHPLDVTDETSVATFAEKVVTDLGPIATVVDSAALVRPGALHEIPSQRFAQEVDVNLIGTHRVLRAFVPGMVAAGRGDLVLVSSDVAARARPFTGAYTASKWGLEGLAQALQMELEGTGVRVSLVRPGPTATEIGVGWDPDETIRLLERWQRFGIGRHHGFLTPEAVADAIAQVVLAPQGVHLHLVEVSPQAPVVGADR